MTLADAKRRDGKHKLANRMDQSSGLRQTAVKGASFMVARLFLQFAKAVEVSLRSPFRSKVI